MLEDNQNLSKSTINSNDFFCNPVKLIKGENGWTIHHFNRSPFFAKAILVKHDSKNSFLNWDFNTSMRGEGILNVIELKGFEDHLRSIFDKNKNDCSDKVEMYSGFSGMINYGNKNLVNESFEFIDNFFKYISKIEKIVYDISDILPYSQWNLHAVLFYVALNDLANKNFMDEVSRKMLSPYEKEIKNGPYRRIFEVSKETNRPMSHEISSSIRELLSLKNAEKYEETIKDIANKIKTLRDSQGVTSMVM